MQYSNATDRDFTNCASVLWDVIATNVKGLHRHAGFYPGCISKLSPYESNEDSFSETNWLHNWNGLTRLHGDKKGFDFGNGLTQDQLRSYNLLKHLLHLSAL